MRACVCACVIALDAPLPARLNLSEHLSGLHRRGFATGDQTQVGSKNKPAT